MSSLLSSSLLAASRKYFSADSEKPKFGFSLNFCYSKQNQVCFIEKSTTVRYPLPLPAQTLPHPGADLATTKKIVKDGVNVNFEVSCCPIIQQDVSIGGNRVKGTGTLYYFFAASCECI